MGDNIHGTFRMYIIGNDRCMAYSQAPGAVGATKECPLCIIAVCIEAYQVLLYLECAFCGNVKTSS